VFYRAAGASEEVCSTRLSLCSGVHDAPIADRALYGTDDAAKAF